MAVEKLNSYEGLFPNNTRQKVVTDTIENAAKALTEGNVVDGESVEPSIIQKMAEGILVEVPDTLIIQFQTIVYPKEAVEGNCIATPSMYKVKNNTEVIFSAVPAEGWNFAGWTRNPTKEPASYLSEEKETSIVVTGDGSKIEEYYAVFTPV